MILVIDQFEEVFTLCKDQTKREKFFQCILDALELTNHKLCVILAMRIDFFGKCFEHSYSGLGKKIEENLTAVPPMEQEELRQAITKPVQKVNLSVEHELVEQMLRDIKGSPGSLPLLQYTLTELWKLRQDDRLTLATYTKSGGIGGTLDKRATEVYDEFDEQQKNTAQHIFLGLTQLGEGIEDTRRRIFKRDLITIKHPENLIDDVVKKLADEKLIVTSEQVEKGASLHREPVIDVAHEALIRNWELLKQWLDESRSKLLEQRKIENNAQDWKTSSYKGDYLLQGFRLKEAKKFQKESSNTYPLSELAEGLIRKSIQQQRKNLVRFLIIPVVGIGILGWFLYRNISIQTAWKVVQETQGEKYDVRRHEALETLAFWREPLKNAPLEKANLQGIDLSSADLSSAILYGANLSFAKLISADLNNSDLNSADFTGTYLRGANLSSANLFSVEFRSANLENTNLSSANLSNADFRGANLEDTNFKNADLNSADFRGANLENTNFKDADLENTDLSNVDNLTPFQIKSACNWDKADYKGQYDTEQEKWIMDEKANQQYIEQLKKDKSSVPKVPPDCSRWG